MKILSAAGLFILLPFFIYSQQTDFKSYKQELSNMDSGIPMIAIQGGMYKTGILANGSRVQVRVNSFWIGKYEIPWEIYELFVYESSDVTKNSSDQNVDAVTRPTPPYLDMTYGMGKYGFPAVGMTQYNTIQFCKWLYIRTGVFYRLPTEAEWEYACRAGTETPYFFSNTIENVDKYAWYADNSGGKTHPLGTKEPNGWGLYDMYGNVAEWTYDQYIPDFYSRFKGKVADNPVAFPEKLYPISFRGGSYKDDTTMLRSDSRNGSDPSWKNMDPQTPKSNWWFPEAPFIGLRIVRPAEPPSKKDIELYYNRKPIADY
jgi:sulfatase modifying factor 1